MSDTLSEIDGQHVELLPARTVMSLFTAQGGAVGGDFDGAATPVAPIMPVMPLSDLTGFVGSGSGGLSSSTTGFVGSGYGSGPLVPVTGLPSGVAEQ
jgi:hypothetical protein